MRTGFQALRKAALAFAYTLPRALGGNGLPGAARAVLRTRPRGGSRRSSRRSRREARARVRRLRRRVGRGRRCRGCRACSRPASMWSCWRRAVTGRSVTSTGPSGPGCGGSTGAAARSATDDQGVGLIAGACLAGAPSSTTRPRFRTPDEVLAEWEGLGFPSASSGRASTQSVSGSGSTPITTCRHGATRRWRRGLESLGWHVDAMPRDVLGSSRASSAAIAATAAHSGRSSRHRERGSRTPRCGRADRGGGEGAARPRRERQRGVVSTGCRCRCGLARSSLRRARSRRTRCCFAPAYQPQRRARAASAPGDRGLRDLLRGDPAVGRDAAGALLGPAPLPRRRLRRQFRDGAAASGAPDGGAAVGGGGGARPADGEPAVALADRRDPARQRRRTGTDRPQRRPIATYRLATDDTRRLAAGIDGAGGSWPPPERARSSQPTRGCSGWRRFPGRRVPLRSGTRLALLVPHHGLGPHGRLTGHVGGLADGETWDVRNLVVADGSAFPTASGVNPMITIEAIAHLNARAWRSGSPSCGRT